ncbi:Lrp/AsnC family transcriptional regulator [Brevibacillus daliensis]|uniref:Lrp/AsnC family transcriptional regulator n=1 Tax=Brevibacillus daliensis TaxID=2892995 RepID=UPI001E635294|nr:winged helix-turn-helix transcriptional regulator [Brevibacillus daliensis]
MDILVAIDLSILDALKENSRITASEISKRVSLSIPAVSERIRKMEEAEIIEAYTIKINLVKTKCSCCPLFLSILIKPNISKSSEKLLFNAVLF